MNVSEKTEKLLKALAGKTRLKILECIQKEISNSGEIARKLGRHRSTVEKHLRVLLKASIVDRVPSLTEGDRLAIRYSMIDNANEFLSKVQEICRKF